MDRHTLHTLALAGARARLAEIDAERIVLEQTINTLQGQPTSDPTEPPKIDRSTRARAYWASPEGMRQRRRLSKLRSKPRTVPE